MVYTTFQRHFTMLWAMAGVSVEPKLDWKHFIASIDKEVHQLVHLYYTGLERAGWINSKSATFIDPHTLEVDGRKVTAGKNFDCCGVSPVAGLPGTRTCLQWDIIGESVSKHGTIGATGWGKFTCIKGKWLGCEVTQIIQKSTLRVVSMRISSNGDQDGMTYHGVRMIHCSQPLSKFLICLKLILSGESWGNIDCRGFFAATGRPNVEDLI